ncbi:MAG: type VII secretion protein EssC [Bacilli bacterium]|nr:type VII secretion protein EssC [Bacilli bacterium]
MRLYLLETSKIFKFNLPVKIDGSFLFSYKDLKTKVENILNVEESNGSWKLKSNGNINILLNGTVMPDVVLQDYSCINLKIGSNPDNKYLFCLPSNDKNVSKYEIGNNTVINIGTGNDCHIIYNNSLTSPKHLGIEFDNGEYYAVPINDANICSYLNDKRIVKREKLHVGDIIFINGLKIIWMRKFIVINNPGNSVNVQSLNLYQEKEITDNTKYTPVSEEESGMELYSEDDYFSHTPRLRTIFEPETVEIDAPPPNQNPDDDLPFLLSMGTSLTMAASSIYMMYSTIYGLANGTTELALGIPMLIMSGAMMIGSLVMPRLIKRYQKKRKIEREKLRQDKYRSYLNEKETYIQRKIREESQIISENNVSLQECYNFLLTNNRTVWSREIKDDDFLQLRFGVGTYPSSIVIKSPQEHFTLDDDNLTSMVYDLPDKYKILNNVPVTLSLTENNIVAFLFDCTFKDDFIKGLMLQTAIYHSALDLKIVLFTNKENESKWEYLKNVPHIWNDEKNMRFFASTTEEAKIISSYLEKEFLARQEAVKPKNSDDTNVQEARDEDKSRPYTKFGTYYMIFTDDYKTLKNFNFTTEFFKDKTNFGFSLIMFDDSMRNLPQECEDFIVIDEKECGIFKKDLMASSLMKFKADYDPTIDMLDVASKLSNIPIQSQEVASSLPNSLSFLEMYNVGKIEQLNILNRWSTNNPTMSLSAPIGVHTNGDLFKLDLHEKFDGPHGLIAGSTGSGKSEFIITYILSMALNYHPYEVQFVLIDYKGGGLAGAFENRETGVHIPHLAGTITNLDTAEMNRTLVSLESELKRRQAKFNEVRDSIGESTMDIYKYQRLYREGVIKEPISHLFIISDEFAELKAQQPDFMAQLISTSRIGRSLGVHLILATQKPSGVVNDQIWSNSKFKVCLKVQSRSDSMEMLKRPDAASIKEAGRFYLQVGYDEYFDIGQSGWSGAKYVPSERIVKKFDDSINFVNNYGAVIKSINDYVKKEDVQDEKGEQLTNIVKYLHALSLKENLNCKKMWLDSLSEFIYLDSLKKKYNFLSKSYNFETMVGEYDAPKKQEQGIFSLDISDKNTLIYGMQGTGKENFITTLLYSLMIHHHPKEVNIYIADFGAETLTIFRSMPHVGDVLVTSESDKLSALIKMLNKEYERRKKKFVDFSGSFIEYNHNNDEKENLLVVVLNSFEGFQEAFSRSSDVFDVLFRDGPKVGITFIVSTSLNNSIRGRNAQCFVNKVCMRLANDMDYRDLVGAARGLVPGNKFGRGIAKMDDEALEFQTAFICEKENINNTIRNTSKYLSDAYNMKAPKIPILPDICHVEDVLFEMKDLSYIPIGVELNSLEVYVYDFTANNINLIVSNYIENHINFIYGLVKEFILLGNLKLKVIDGNGIFKKKYEGVEIFNDNFDDVIKAISDETLSNNSDVAKNIYIFIGISSIKEKLNNDNKNVLENLFTNSKNLNNSIFIFVDDYSSIKKVQVELWYRNVVDESNGIWLGEGVGDQLAIKVSTLTLDDKKIMFPYIGYPIYKENHMIVKYVVDGVEEENEE